jgi:hypothetical protein
VVGSVVLVAANGDELYTTYSGILNININGNGTAYYQFVGGTGRFGGASGNGLIIASFDLSGGLQNVPMDSQWFGTVEY